MSVAIVTGFGGLIGSESVRHFVDAGFDVVAVANDMRAYCYDRNVETWTVAA